MRKIAIYILTILTLACFVACSPKKNTALSRNVQAFKTIYNTYYNGHLAYKDGVKAQQDGNKDNYTEPLPVFPSTAKGTVKAGSGNYSTAIEKCQKAIKQHSITARPKWNSSRKKTEKDKIWLSQKEYNPWLYKPWFLMGEAQFKRGDYMEAASTFSYIQNIYFSKPDFVAKARVMEARSYAAMEWYFEAEDIIARAEKDSFPANLQNLKSRVLADVEVRQKRYEEAIPHMLRGVKAAETYQDKTRLYFLLGQLYQKTGKNVQASQYFKKVVRRNPPYELEFNARIKMTECMTNARPKAVIRRLKAMARNQKNKDYLDQIYYAIGNVYLAQGDTVHALWAYNDGVEKATRTGYEKGILLVHLGQLYYDTEQFVKAQGCFSQALGMFDKEHEDYNAIDERAKVLEELLPSAQAVELQDSLQNLAKMDSVERMKVIAKMIEEVKKKEKEEQRKQTEAEVAKNNPKRQINNTANGQNGQGGGVWYFYNSNVISSGKTEFQRKWGTRELADDWNRKNKTVLEDFNDSSEDLAQLGDSVMTDSLGNPIDSQGNPIDMGGAPDTNVGESSGSEATSGDGKLSAKEEKQRAKEEEYLNDPHRPEYYLKDIPFTDEQMEASNKLLVEGLYGSAVIFKDRMDNLPLTERTFMRILNDFPEFEKTDEIYYNLYQLYSRYGRLDEAAVYKQKLIDAYPDNEHGKMIADPDYEYKARYGKAIEDSLYTAAYEAFKASDYETVLAHNEYTEKEYPNGQNRARFMFVTAMSQLEMGHQQDFAKSLKAIVEKFPQSTVSELAGLYVKGLKEGRLLASGKFEMGSAWDRRFIFDDGDSTAIDTTFTTEKNNDWLFAIAYERDSISENQLLFEMAKYNFQNFTVRNFDITFDKGPATDEGVTFGINMLQVRQFANYDEAYIYLHRISNNEEMKEKLQGLKCFIISEENLKKIMKGLSFADYFDFYDQNFDRVGHLDIEVDLLEEPTELPEPMDESDSEDGDEYEDEDDFF